MKLQNNRGAVTIFHAIVFMAVLLLAGLLADAARIAVAERKVQSSLNTAARSVLAGYDEELAGGYGLFGLDTDSEESQVIKDLTRYLKANLKERHKGMSFINYELDESSIRAWGMGCLLSKEVYKHQILEYMKYKAPITITENVINKFKSARMPQKVDFGEKEKAAREAGRNVKQSVGRLNRTLKDISASLGKTAVKEFKKTLKDAAEKDPKEAIREITGMLDKCKRVMEEIDLLKKEQESYLKAKAESDKAAQIAGGNPTHSEIKGISSIEELEINLKRNIERLMSLSAQLEDKIKPGNIKGDEIKNIIDGFEIEELKALPQDTDFNEAFEHQKDESDAKGFFEKLKEAFGKKLLLNSIKEEWKITDSEFKSAMTEDDNKFGEMSESLSNLERLTDEKVAEKENRNILDFIRKISSLLEDAAVNTRDNIYITEYIMDKYTFMTSRTERGHFFNKAEVEYILWGKDTQCANAGLVLGQVWFLRFGIDSLDYFLTGKIPHPAARLVWALVEGAARAFIDIFNLYNGKTIAVCPSAEKIKPMAELSYSDHLRMFLLLQPEDTKLNRMLQLVQINLINIKKASNKDFRLRFYNTSIRAQTEVRVNLWILPLFQLDKLGFEQFRGGRYVVRKEVCMGY